MFKKKGEQMEILAVIPARSGSKSIVDKNIREIDGKPMLAYSIEHAKASKYITRIIVSTDSERYAQIARYYGAETPFLRPEQYATDSALDIDVFQHALNFLSKTEHYLPEIVVHLRPTYPIRRAEDIDCMIEMLLQAPEADAVRCIAPAKEIAYKMWRLNKKNEITPLLNDIPEAYNRPRQSLPTIYYQNACIDVIRTQTILKKNSMTGDRILGYIMDNNYDIDTEEEFQQAKRQIELNARPHRFVFDIDGVVAQFRDDLDYSSACPNQKMIHCINALYDAGNQIVLFTARGYKTGIDWRDTTERQMREWGVKYHELKFGKPDADYYIDDKMLGIQKVLN